MEHHRSAFVGAAIAAGISADIDQGSARPIPRSGARPMNDLGISSGMLLTGAIALAALIVSSIIRFATLRFRPSEKSSERIASLKSWWCVALLVIGAAVGGRLAIVALMGMVSLLAMHEFVSLPKSVPLRRSVRISTYVLVVTSYVMLGAGFVDQFVCLTPLLAVAVPGVTLIASGTADDAVNQIARASFATLVTIALGHAALLAYLPLESNPVAGPAGWFLFLVATTQINDIAQALVGRRIGRMRITQVSPAKTWEGFVGGVVIAVVVAVGLSRLLTPMSVSQTIVASLLISIAGLLGDLNMSLVKRDAGVKDSGTLVPGQGGILDRIDSLTFTAPAFYYFIVAAHSVGESW
jgi:phosphatidate cytidylyltransferase